MPVPCRCLPGGDLRAADDAVSGAGLPAERSGRGQHDRGAGVLPARTAVRGFEEPVPVLVDRRQCPAHVDR